MLLSSCLKFFANFRLALLIKVLPIKKRVLAEQKVGKTKMSGYQGHSMFFPLNEQSL